MGKPTDGRLVWNHSTHISGLIAILERLCQQDGIHTVTPAVIGRARGHCPKMQLRVSVPIRGGYKVIARQGKTVQEVFVITTLELEQLEIAIAIAMKIT
ncbi:DUF2103 domain-containing protein [Anabaena catenula]|uniref:Metal-binding protein n=1 Tax=Anabaena catenula FACHB-362 TaxID=2692877 RepID=A0ABR8J1W2_9NOST|nr:DUF2103 domain-containing protein [Anabaena catenula]MBD2691550.1 metal-binding protein [Anabaena catenula FACHB-362]